MMTFSAWLIRKAASSALPGFHGRCSFEPPAPAAASSPPKPPAITLMKLRFIARHMMYDRIAPDEPTSAPVMIIAVLPSVKRSEEHTSELQSLMRISYAVFCLKKKKHHT